MGNYIGLLSIPLGIGQKRKRDDLDDDSENENDEIEKKLHIAKRKKGMATSKYIYQTLFCNGENSDIVIKALNTEWKLHRIYLCQSPYFSSMFTGGWKEAQLDTVEIQIADPHITPEALKIVFGSLYQDEITVEPAQAIHVLGAATLFQLDWLIQQCIEIMKESINIQTVTRFYDAALRYGLKPILKETFNWLLHNLLSCFSDHPKKLGEIGVDLMAQLVASPELFVFQSEFSIYVLLKIWVFVSENPTWDGSTRNCVTDAHNFFKELTDPCFLQSENGRKYAPAFEALRLQHLIIHHLDVKLLEDDRIIPKEWLMPLYEQQWIYMLRLDEGIDRGPKNLSENNFLRMCLRCGRILPAEGLHIWRWTGFNFGLDIVVTFEGRWIKLRRNARHDGKYQNAVSQQFRRNLMFRVTVASLDDQRQVKFSTTTGIKKVTLCKNQEVRILKVDKEAQFPLILSANFLFYTPLKSESVLPDQDIDEMDADPVNQEEDNEGQQHLDQQQEN